MTSLLSIEDLSKKADKTISLIHQFYETFGKKDEYLKLALMAVINDVYTEGWREGRDSAGGTV